MRKQVDRRVRFDLEGLEAREVPSALLYAAVAQKQATYDLIRKSLARLTLKTPPFVAPPNNAANVLNPLLSPSGVPSPAESRRETFRATIVGEYTLGPGRFSTEAGNFYFRGIGRTSTVLHADLQMRVIRPIDPTQPSTGEVSLFDRNIDSNSDLGFDLYAAPENVDRFGRPTHLVIYALDPNVSSGNYVEGIAQGTIDVRYGPVPRTPHFRPAHRLAAGAVRQGTASMVINAQVYGIGTTFSLRNVDINP